MLKMYEASVWGLLQIVGVGCNDVISEAEAGDTMLNAIIETMRGGEKKED